MNLKEKSSEELARMFKETSDSDIELELYSRHKKMMYSCIRKYASKYTILDTEDYLQVCFFALHQALIKYQDDKKTKFSTFLFEWIRGSIYHQNNQSDYTVSVPHRKQYLAKQVQCETQSLEQLLQKNPSIEECASYSKRTVEEIILARMIQRQRYTYELDNTIIETYADMKQEESRTSMFQYDNLYDAMNDLTLEERKILNLRIYQNCTFREIGLEFGYSRQAAEKKYQRMLEKLKQIYIQRENDLNGYSKVLKK